MQTLRNQALILVLALFALSAPASAQSAQEAKQWMTELQSSVFADLAEGKPLVVQVHVPLCDNRIIRCGRHGLGDGDAPNTNLYWRTSGGFLGWFGRSKSGWKEVHKRTPKKGDLLEVRIWKRRFRPSAKQRARGVKKSFDTYVVAYAWRGTAIQSAMNQYVADLYGGDARTEIAGTRSIAAGGAAHLVAFVGHNGWMDVSSFRFEKPKNARASKPKGTIALACHTESYLAQDIPDEKRVPLLLTRSLLFAGAHAFEGAVTAFARGQNLKQIRHATAANYAKGQGKSLRRVNYAFTNPSHRTWRNLKAR